MVSIGEIFKETFSPSWSHSGLQNIFLCPEPRILETFRALWKIIKLYHSFPPSLPTLSQKYCSFLFYWLPLMFDVYFSLWMSTNTHTTNFTSGILCPLELVRALYCSYFAVSTKTHNKKVQSGDLWSLESVRARDRRSQRSRSSASLVSSNTFPLIFFLFGYVFKLQYLRKFTV